MTLAQLDALLHAENKTRGGTNSGRQMGTTADLAALAAGFA